MFARSMHVCGIVLWLLVYTDIMDPLAPRQPPAASYMERVWSEVQAIYTQRGTTSQLNFLELRSFTDPDAPRSDYPHLRGKGAEIRHLVPVLLTIWRKYQQSRAQHIRYEAHVTELLEHLV